MIFEMLRSLLILICFAIGPDLRAQVVGAGYRLNPMDKLSVSIAQDPAPGRPVELSVSPLGDLVVPVSRCCEESVVLSVRGKSVEEVEKELKTRLEADFYQTATVQVRVIDPTRRKGQVLLRGAVRATSVQLDSGKPKTLWEALTEVGTTDFANLKKVKLDRVDANGKSQITTHDIEAVDKGDRTKDIELRDGDRVTVPESLFKLR
jgi:protein involved in polysaccharide export with SLBB domain